MWLRTVLGLMPSESALCAEDMPLLVDRFLTEFSARYHHLPKHSDEQRQCPHDDGHIGLLPGVDQSGHHLAHAGGNDQPPRKCCHTTGTSLRARLYE